MIKLCLGPGIVEHLPMPTFVALGLRTADAMSACLRGSEPCTRYIARDRAA